MLYDTDAYDETLGALIAKYDKIEALKKQQEEKKRQLEQEERNRKYWEKHATEKASLKAEYNTLDAKTKSLNSELNEINARVDAQINALRAEKEERTPSEKAVAEQTALICSLETERKSLGIFKGKDKKAIDSRLSDIERPKLEQLKKNAQSERIKVNTSILINFDTEVSFNHLY